MLSAFEDESNPPTPRSLAQALGPASVLWRRLQAALQADHGPLAEQWKYAGKSLGWSFRLKDEKRVFVYMTPGRGHFLASFVLGERACAAARVARLPQGVLDSIEAAPRYAEGRGIRFAVRTKADVACVQALAALKAAHGARSARARRPDALSPPRRRRSP